MNTHHREQGFSLIEMMVVVLITMIVAAMALIALDPTRQQVQADAAMVQVASQLRLARETAIEQRRDVLVSFDTTANTITLTQQNLPSGSTVLSTIPLQVPARFMLMPGMSDTPDGFGDISAVYFEGVTDGPVGMGFQSDGTFIDGVGNLVNGTVFLGITGVPSSARAVTVLGATGKIRMYKASGSGWQQ